MNKAIILQVIFILILAFVCESRRGRLRPHASKNQGTNSNDPVQVYKAHHDMITHINSKQKMWVAGHNKFSHYSDDELRRRSGENHIPHDQLPLHARPKQWKPKNTLQATTGVPNSWDWSKSSSCIIIRDQQQCGDCWTWAGTSVVAERNCIQNNSTVVSLSAQYVSSCFQSSPVAGSGPGYCSGGTSSQFYVDAKTVGIPTEACVPFTSGNGTCIPTICPTTCIDGKPISSSSLSYVTSYTSYPLNNPLPVMQEIYKNGPIHYSILDYRELSAYKSGIYSYSGNSTLLGHHAIRIVGYNYDPTNATPSYWIVANQWAKTWGMNGFAYFLMSNNATGANNGVDVSMYSTAIKK